MAIDKIFDGAVDGIADNLFNSVSNSVSEIKAMQQRKAAENVQLVVQALKKIDADIREKYDGVTETIEKRVANIKDGRDGIDGKNGLDGVNGKDGRDGKDGRNGRDGLTGPRGFDGPKGADGKDGRDGEDGVSVTDAHIDFDGSLIISLSSGRVINVGEVVSADIAEKIKVITNGGGTSQPVLDQLASLQAQIDLISSALVYKGTWNASTNTPTLTSSVGTANTFYIVSVAGTTNLNGTSNWGVGDWAVYNGSVWQRIEGGAVGNFTDLSVSGTTTLSGLTASTALALNASKEIVSVTNTGSGNNVLATSPTLVTPVLGTPSSVTLTNATGLPLSTGVTGTLPIANGGTGATTANTAFNALAPSQTGNSGKYLTTNGTSTSWATVASGTVTSVAATVPSFLSITGSPITSSGTLAISLSGTALPTTSGGTGLTSFTANGVVYASSSSALTTGSALTFDGSKLVNTGYDKSTYFVATGGVASFESSGGAYLSYASGANIYSFSDGSGTEAVLNLRASSHLFYINSAEQARLNTTGLGIGTNSPGSKLDVKGTLRLSGSTSGYVGLAPAAAAGSTTYTLPSADGTANQALVTNGSGTLSWASTTTGTVTSVSGTGTVSGISLSGTVTSSGNLTLGGALDLSAYGGAGAFTTLSASSTVTLSGGTANGVAYLNGSKVVTSGSALTFDGTNFASTGIITSTNANGLRAQYPSSASYYAQLDSRDGNTYLSAVGSTAAIVFRATDGPGTTAEGMRLTSTGLGINTSSPANKLDVNNTGGSTTGGIRVYATDQAYARLNVQNANGQAYHLVAGTPGASNSGFAIYDATAGATRVQLDSSGNVGIGTSSPAQTLHVKTSTAATPITLGVLSNSTTLPALSFNGAYASTTMAGTYSLSGSLYTTVPSGAAQYFSVADSIKLTLDSAGNLGLGVTPSAFTSTIKALQIGPTSVFRAGDTGYTQATFVASNARQASAVDYYIANGYASQYGQQAGAHYWYTAASGTAGTAITFTQAMTLTAAGLLGVGTTSPSQKIETDGRIRVTSNGTNGGDMAVDQGGLAFSSLSTTPIVFERNNFGSESARFDGSGNFGIGTISPATKLHVAGGSLFTGSYSGYSGGEVMLGATTADIQNAVSTQATGSTVLLFDHRGTSNTGLFAWRNGSGGANELMRLTSTGLGIGTSSPTDKLTLNSSGSGTGFKITGYQPENFINLNNTLSTGNRTFRLLSGITSVGYDGFSVFDTVANATRLVINNSGNLGIGTTSPSYKLDVNGDARINNLLWFTPSSGGMALGANGTNFEIYNGAGTETRLTLNNSGNLGLGVIPSAWGFGGNLELPATNNISFQGAYGNINSNAYYDLSQTRWEYITSGYAAQYQIGSAGQHIWNTAGSGTAGNAISFTQAMTLAASGGLSIGVTSDAGAKNLLLDAGGKLAGNAPSGGTSSTIELYNASTGNMNLTAGYSAASITFATGGTTERARIDSSGNFLVGTTSSSLTSGNGIKLNADNRLSVVNDGGVEGFIYYNSAASAYRFYVSGSGTISATNTTISAISDIRFKENVRDLDVGLNAVMALKPRLYDWKEGKGANIKNARGFIAQEFEEVFPDLIDEWKDPAPEGEAPYKSVRQDLIPVLVKAIQEQQAIINSLKARLDAANL